MPGNEPAGRPSGTHDIAALLSRSLLRIGILLLVLVAILFISSGHHDWVMAWVYVGALVVGIGVRTLILARSNPELIVERTQIKEDAKDWDRVLASLMALVGPAFTWIVAGVDMRFGWSPRVPLLLQIVALALAMLGDALLTWAMISNRFF